MNLLRMTDLVHDLLEVKSVQMGSSQTEKHYWIFIKGGGGVLFGIQRLFFFSFAIFILSKLTKW